MSYITFDYKCPSCAQVDSRMVKREDMDDQVCRPCVRGNPHNDVRMIRLPPGTRTHFRFADTKLKD